MIYSDVRYHYAVRTLNFSLIMDFRISGVSQFVIAVATSSTTPSSFECMWIRYELFSICHKVLKLGSVIGFPLVGIALFCNHSLSALEKELYV